MSKTIKAALLAAVFAAATGGAHATTITFNDIPADNDHYLIEGATFSTAGYDFTVKRRFVYFVNGDSEDGDATNGTTGLDLGGIVDFTSAANKPFSVTSIDMATLWAEKTSTVKFTGTAASGAQTVQSFTNDGQPVGAPAGLRTVALSGFDNLTSFEMELVYNPEGDTWFSLVDNIVIDDATAAVPEPSTFATLGLGLATLAGALRRRKRSAVGSAV